MRDKVLEFFRDLPKSESEQFNKAFDLFRNSPGASAASVRSYNAIGYSKHNLPMLLYDLQMLHGIKDVEKEPVIKIPTKTEKLKAAILAGGTLVLVAMKLAVDYPKMVLPEEASQDLKDFVSKAAEAMGSALSGFVAENEIEEFEFLEALDTCSEEIRSVEYPDAIAAELQKISGDTTDDNSGTVNRPEGEPAQGTVAPSETTLPGTNDGTQDPTKMRDEYPYLKEADCPNELKILVSDKITAYNAYKDAHEKLQKNEAGELALNEKEKVELAAAATQNFEEGERIKAELDHYLQNKELLGQHPIFAKLALEREVEAMSIDDCMKFIKNTPSYNSKKNTAIKNAVSEDKKAELQADIDARNEKLALVNKKLGTTGGK